MSLPTLAKIYKNDKIIAVAHCNVGWFITSNGLYGCIQDILFTVSDYFQDKMDNDIKRRYDEQYPNSFGTFKDITSFDYIEMYNYIFPFELSMQVFFNKITIEEFEQICIKKGITNSRTSN